MKTETQAERLLAELLRGRRLTKVDILDELGIWNSGGRVHELRARGYPIATIWLDQATGEVTTDGNGKPRVWFGGDPHDTHQPGAGCYVAYQLYCRGCKVWRPEDLGWRWALGEGGDLAEFEKTFLCPRCLADARMSTAGQQLTLAFEPESVECQGSSVE